MRGYLFWEKIAGFYPSYEEGEGRKSIILCTDGTVLKDKRAIRTLLGEAASLYAVELSKARQKGREVSGKKQEVPIALAPRLLLVPLRACKPVVPKDGTIGYFSLFAISGVENHDEGCFRSALLLKGNHRLPLLQSRETVEQKILLAKVIYREYVQRQGIKDSGLLKDQEEKPATQRDIAMLIHELWDLKYLVLKKG